MDNTVFIRMPKEDYKKMMATISTALERNKEQIKQLESDREKIAKLLEEK